MPANSLKVPSTEDQRELSLNYAHRRRWMRLGVGSYVWLPNPDVVLTPDPIGSWWKDIVYWFSGFFFVAAIIVVGVHTEGSNCNDQPGPCFFNFISHWYYIWYNVQFFIWALARHFTLARWLAYELHWFNFGSAWTWSVLTTLLLISLTRQTVESMLPESPLDDVGIYVLSLLILHYWPLAVMLWFTAQWGECIGAFWARRLSWMSAYLTVLSAVILMFVEIWSPAIFWIIYLSIFNPIVIYGIAPTWAQNFLLGYVVGIAVIMWAGVALGAYLHRKVHSLMERRMKEYSEHYYHQHPQHHQSGTQPRYFTVIGEPQAK